VAIFKHKYSTGSAVTCLSCGGIFNESTAHKAVSVANSQPCTSNFMMTGWLQIVTTAISKCHLGISAHAMDLVTLKVQLKMYIIQLNF